MAEISGNAHRWLPLRELQRLFAAAPREVVLYASDFSREHVSALQSRLTARGYQLKVTVAPNKILADAISNSRPPAAITILLPDGVPGRPDWNLPVLALRDAGAYGPSTLLAFRRRDFRSAALQVARGCDMAIVDLADLEGPDAIGRALADSAVSLSKPHPGLYGFLLFPLAAAAILALRLRS
jgi:hypothetical protein